MDEEKIRNLVINPDHNSREEHKDYLIFNSKNKGSFSKSINRAIYESNKRGRLPIFSKDVKFSGVLATSAPKGAKIFIVSSYASLWEKYIRMEPNQRCIYEILLHEYPCHLYIDIDMNREINSKIDKNMEKKLEDEFLEECTSLLLELGATNSKDSIKILTLDSSKGKKLSKHFIFHIDGVRFKNNYHCGAFVRRIRNRFEIKYGTDYEKNRFFLKKEQKGKKKEDQGKTFQIFDFYADLAVYTCRRNWRIYGSSKGDENRPLYLSGEDNTKTRLNQDNFLACMIQRIDPSESENINLFECLEMNETEPYSTNNTSFMNTRDDIPLKSDNSELKHYYETYFPFDDIYKLFGQNNTREFFFSNKDNGIWKKYFFKSVDEFKNKILKTVPSTIHLGPFVDGKKQKELVFDIDLNDYRNVRTCCGDSKKACEKCWKYAQFGILVLDRFLRNYGFENILFFFSGMKGFHCWVLDEKAKKLSNKAREALVKDLQLDNLQFNIIGKKRKYVSDIVKNGFDYKKVIIEQNLKNEFDNACNKFGLELAICYFFWPKIDKEVTTNITHAIKIPYIKHPITGNPSKMIKNDASDNPFCYSSSDTSLSENIKEFSNVINT